LGFAINLNLQWDRQRFKRRGEHHVMNICQSPQQRGVERSAFARKHFVAIAPEGAIEHLSQAKCASLQGFSDRKLEFAGPLRLQCALIERGGA